MRVVTRFEALNSHITYCEMQALGTARSLLMFAVAALAKLPAGSAEAITLKVGTELATQRFADLDAARKAFNDEPITAGKAA